MDAIDTLVADYRVNDYVVVKGFFPKVLASDHLAYLKAALAKDVAPIFARIGVDLDASTTVTQAAKPISSEVIASLDPAVKHVLLGHFPLHVRLSDHIKPLAEYLGRSSLLKQLLGSAHLYMHMPPMMRFVPPRHTPASVPAHQDVSYNTHMTEFVTVWTPLVPIDQDCGGLVIFEGSQHHVQSVGQADNGWLDAIDTSAYPRKQLVDVEPGDVVVLSPRIVHASAPNLSNRIRFSMDLRIFGSSGRSTKHHMNLDTLEVIGS